MASSQPWTPGTGGAQPPVRGSVATVPWIWWQPLIPVLCGISFHSPRLPPFGSPPKPYRDSHVQAIARRAERGRRCGLTVVKHRDAWSRQIAPAPPNRHNRFSGKTLNRPLGFLRPGLHGLPALSRVLDLPCVTGRRGMSAFSRDLYFFNWADQPAQRPDTLTGA